MADVVERADVGVIQACNGSSFPIESFTQFGSAGEMIRQDFDRDDSIESCVFFAINFAHSTSANSARDLIWTEFRASGERHLFNPAVQFKTTVMGAEVTSDESSLIRKRRPSAVMSYC